MNAHIKIAVIVAVGVVIGVAVKGYMDSQAAA